MRRNAIWVGTVLAVVAAVYWPDTTALVRYWLHKDVNAQSGILIALLSGFLLFRARGRLDGVAMRPAPSACLPLIACAAASLICWRAGILTLQLVFLPPILWLGVLCLLGWQAARAAGFAIGFLYFALPGWDLLRPALQHLTAWAVGLIGPLVGLPVAVAGTIASLPGGVRFAIEPACSGADFLVVGLAIAALHGELEQASARRRAGLAGAMVLLAILSNWVRVILILAVGYLSDMRSPLATRGHAAFGWVIFACALMAFVWAAGRSSVEAADAPAAGEPEAHSVAQVISHRKGAAWGYGVAALALLAVPALVYGSLLETAARASAAALELPPGRAPWSGPAGAVDPQWQPAFVGAHTELRARYQSADGPAVEVVAIGFPRQTQGAQIFNDNNFLLGERGLSIAAVALVHDGGIPHGEVIAVDADGRRSLIWSVIDVGGHLFAEPLISQLWYGARSVTGAPYSALFALRAQCGLSCETARRVLADFVRANGSALFASLPGAGAQD